MSADFQTSACCFATDVTTASMLVVMLDGIDCAVRSFGPRTYLQAAGD